MFQLNKKRLLALAFIFLALVLLTQSNPSFLFIVPILIFTIIVSWYLYKEIEKDNEESLKRGIHYLQEEQEAQHWLKKSFVPRTRTLAKRELRSIIFASGFILLIFIFLWSFFVSGIMAAILNSLMGLLFFVGFIIYTLYAPKEFTRLFKHVPHRYSHHSKNDWVHAYLLLLPFVVTGFFLYSITTTGEGIVRSFWETIAFVFSYTLLFVSVYCMWFLYRDYQKKLEESLKKETKKMLQK